MGEVGRVGMWGILRLVLVFVSIGELVKVVGY